MWWKVYSWSDRLISPSGGEAREVESQSRESSRQTGCQCWSVTSHAIVAEVT